MPLAPEYFTADMVRALPDDGQRHEVVSGELLVTPGPTWNHQRIALRLARMLAEACDASETLEALMAPADVSWNDYTLVQPDVFVARKVGPQEADPPHAPELVLVAEVLSPSSARHDRFPKRSLYQRQRIPAIWLVDPERRFVEVWTPEASAPRIEREGVEWIDAAHGIGMTVDLARLFESS